MSTYACRACGSKGPFERFYMTPVEAEIIFDPNFQLHPEPYNVGPIRPGNGDTEDISFTCLKCGAEADSADLLVEKVA